MDENNDVEDDDDDANKDLDKDIDVQGPQHGQMIQIA